MIYQVSDFLFSVLEMSHKNTLEVNFYRSGIHLQVLTLSSRRISCRYRDILVLELIVPKILCACLVF